MKKEDEKFASSTVMEGMVSIRAVLSSDNGRKIEEILYDKARSEAKMKEIAYLRHRGEELGFEVKAVNSEEIDKKCIGNSHGGLIALCSERTLPSLSENDISGDFWVMLEGIEDPYNFGYCLRSLYAAGANGIIVPPRNWMTAAGVVCRASAGASELFKIFISDSAEAAKLFHKKNFAVIAADKTKDSISIYDADIKRPLLLIVGGEKRGITHAALAECDKVVSLDYGRDFPAALSAASAAAIIAFEIFRRGRK